MFEGERIVSNAEHMILYYLNETDITIFYGGGKIEIGNVAPLAAIGKSIRRK